MGERVDVSVCSGCATRHDETALVECLLDNYWNATRHGEGGGDEDDDCSVNANRWRLPNHKDDSTNYQHRCIKCLVGQIIPIRYTEEGKAGGIPLFIDNESSRHNHEVECVPSVSCWCFVRVLSAKISNDIPALSSAADHEDNSDTAPTAVGIMKHQLWVLCRKITEDNDDVSFDHGIHTDNVAIDTEWYATDFSPWKTYMAFYRRKHDAQVESANHTLGWESCKEQGSSSLQQLSSKDEGHKLECVGDTDNNTGNNSPACIESNDRSISADIPPAAFSITHPTEESSFSKNRWRKRKTHSEEGVFLPLDKPLGESSTQQQHTKASASETKPYTPVYDSISRYQQIMQNQHQHSAVRNQYGYPRPTVSRFPPQEPPFQSDSQGWGFTHHYPIFGIGQSHPRIGIPFTDSGYQRFIPYVAGHSHANQMIPRSIVYHNTTSSPSQRPSSPVRNRASYAYSNNQTRSGGSGGIDNGNSKHKTRLWTIDEDRILLEAIVRSSSPSAGSKSLLNTTSSLLHAAVATAAASSGVRWPRIAELVPHRTGKQCRERYYNHLRPSVKIHDWTPIEDALLCRLVRTFGSRWASIAKFISGRTDNSVKNRFHHLRRRLLRYRRARLSAAIVATAERSTSPLRKDEGAAVDTEEGDGGQGNNDRMHDFLMTVERQVKAYLACDDISMLAPNDSSFDFCIKQAQQESYSEGKLQQCERCSLIVPSAQTGNGICTRTGWCQTCTSLPVFLNGDALRAVSQKIAGHLPKRVSLEDHDRPVFEFKDAE